MGLRQLRLRLLIDCNLPAGVEPFRVSNLPSDFGSAPGLVNHASWYAQKAAMFDLVKDIIGLECACHQ